MDVSSRIPFLLILSNRIEDFLGCLLVYNENASRILNWRLFYAKYDAWEKPPYWDAND